MHYNSVSSLLRPQYQTLPRSSVSASHLTNFGFITEDVLFNLYQLFGFGVDGWANNPSLQNGLDFFFFRVFPVIDRNIFDLVEKHHLSYSMVQYVFCFHTYYAHRSSFEWE